MARIDDLYKEINRLQNEVRIIRNEESAKYQSEQLKDFEDNIKGRSFVEESPDYIKLVKLKELPKNFEFGLYCSVPCHELTLLLTKRPTRLLALDVRQTVRLDTLKTELSKKTFMVYKRKILARVNNELNKLF